MTHTQCPYLHDSHAMPLLGCITSAQICAGLTASEVRVRSDQQQSTSTPTAAREPAGLGEQPVAPDMLYEVQHQVCAYVCMSAHNIAKYMHPSLLHLVMPLLCCCNTRLTGSVHPQCDLPGHTSSLGMSCIPVGGWSCP